MCSCNNAVLPCCRYTTGQAGGKAKATDSSACKANSIATALPSTTAVLVQAPGDKRPTDEEVSAPDLSMLMAQRALPI
jgi:hypothetical protein